MWRGCDPSGSTASRRGTTSAPLPPSSSRETGTPKEPGPFDSPCWRTRPRSNSASWNSRSLRLISAGSRSPHLCVGLIDGRARRGAGHGPQPRRPSPRRTWPRDHRPAAPVARDGYDRLARARAGRDILVNRASDAGSTVLARAILVRGPGSDPAVRFGDRTGSVARPARQALRPGRPGYSRRSVLDVSDRLALRVCRRRSLRQTGRSARARRPPRRRAVLGPGPGRRNPLSSRRNSRPWGRPKSVCSTSSRKGRGIAHHLRNTLLDRSLARARSACLRPGGLGVAPHEPGGMRGRRDEFTGGQRGRDRTFGLLRRPRSVSSPRATARLRFPQRHARFRRPQVRGPARARAVRARSRRCLSQDPGSRMASPPLRRPRSDRSTCAPPTSSCVQGPRGKSSRSATQPSSRRPSRMCSIPPTWKSPRPPPGPSVMR